MTHGFREGPSLFDPITDDFCSGEMVAITGPSGRGKSTLLSLIAGELIPAQGSIDRYGVTRAIWIFQNPHGSPRRTVLDHVVLPLLAGGMSRTRAEPVALGHLERFGLAENASSTFRTLSGGEAQRLMLARAVASGADLLLVDEPTAQLDATNAAMVAEVLAALRDDGHVVVLATHDRTLAATASREIRL